MKSTQLSQIRLCSKSGICEPAVRYARTENDIIACDEEDTKFRQALLRFCPAELWPESSYAAGCPRPILVDQYHQQQLQILHRALTISLKDIVQRWWTDDEARFPERMPLEKKEEDLLKWIDEQATCGLLREYSEPGCLGSWRPDFLVDTDENGREKYRITEINARFSFNGFMHLFYGQTVINESLPAGSGLAGAVNPEEILEALFRLFDPQYPLHLLKGVERGIDIHIFVDFMWRRFGIRVRIVSPADLRLFPDSRNRSGFRLCCRISSETQADGGAFQPTPNGGEVWEEIQQVGLELHQQEIVALEPEMLRQISLRCFNDMRTVLLVHDKRMLGIIREEIPNLLRRSVISCSEAKALSCGIVVTILPGSQDLCSLIQATTASPQLRHQYLLKPIRGGKGEGILFGDEATAEEWLSRLGQLRSPDITSGKSCVVQMRIFPSLYDMVLKPSGVVKYPLVGTYHATGGKLVGLGTWRTNTGRIIAVSSGGTWICSVVSQ
ncbi:hypothetical protein P154DRAFT_499105 [Amniculicola lignicola CBS 123094]|uniref:Uncharacterized protein n=1 Tax=Amniculicola lignicola CBS 123094 TaxID=1392246 RepID=A0A6A5W571_9PLEO|nr:hypothetical protein P154DRAFT_499105 [Amniculicola lignicola CBS 123094]